MRARRHDPLETSVEDTVVQSGEARGILTPKLTVPGQRGWPDRLLLAPGGRAAFWELKRRGRTPEPLQLYIHDQLRALGFPVEVVDESAAVAALMDEWLNGST